MTSKLLVSVAVILAVFCTGCKPRASDADAKTVYFDGNCYATVSLFTKTSAPIEAIGQFPCDDNGVLAFNSKKIPDEVLTKANYIQADEFETALKEEFKTDSPKTAIAEELKSLRIKIETQMAELKEAKGDEADLKDFQEFLTSIDEQVARYEEYMSDRALKDGDIKYASSVLLPSRLVEILRSQETLYTDRDNLNPGTKIYLGILTSTFKKSPLTYQQLEEQRKAISKTQAVKQKDKEIAAARRTIYLLDEEYLTVARIRYQLTKLGQLPPEISVEIRADNSDTDHEELGFAEYDTPILDVTTLKLDAATSRYSLDSASQTIDITIAGDNAKLNYVAKGLVLNKKTELAWNKRGKKPLEPNKE
jgi:hypothetical protein